MGGAKSSSYEWTGSNDMAGSYSERSSVETSRLGHFSDELTEVLAARSASKNFHFSRSLVIVGLGSVSYLLWTWLLCWSPPRNPFLQQQFYSQVPPTIYMWPMVGFATASALNLISLAFERRTTKRQLCFMAVYISSCAFLYEFLAWKEWAPIWETSSGRPHSILRYVMWGHATPAMLYALGMMSDLSRQRVLNTIILDIVMIVTAVPGELTSGWHRWFWNGISWAVSPYVFWHLWVMYRAGIKESTDDASRKALRALRNSTVLFWCSFPLVWSLVQLDLVDLRTEEILWSCADFLGKIVFSSTLLHGNFMTIEHRRYMAMRVVEEANRVRVIHELRELLEQKEQFIALMSHELRTPLNGIIGLSNTLLAEGTGMDGDAHKTVSTIHNSGWRLLNLINDILDAAALRKGKLVVQQSKVNLRNVTDDVLDLTQPLAKPGVAVTNHIPATLPAVAGDTARIVQILYNLIGNACKFTEKGEIWVDAAVSGATVAVRVHDTGIGIPSDKLEDIFSPFQQVDMSTTRRYGGTGLGLNLVKQLVEAHGGSISVVSKRGTGSTFTFFLKAWTDSMANPKLPPNLSLPSGGIMGAAAAAAANGAAEYPIACEARQSPMQQRGGAPAQRSADGRWSPPCKGREEEGERVSPGGTPRRHSLCGPPHRVEEEAVREYGAGGGSLRYRGGWSLDGDTLAEDAAAVREMWRRLSVDCKARSSYETEASEYHKAPQQLEPSHAASVFAGAAAPPPRPPADELPPRQAALLQLKAAAAAAAAEAQPAQPPDEGGGDAEGVGAGEPPEAEGEGEGTWWEAERKVREAERSGAIQILSVDDDPVNQMVIQRMLSKAGFRVIKAATGEKALDLMQDAAAAGSPPDLVLLDVMMPGMSGYEVARCLRAQYPHLMLPIIMVSANKLEEHVVEGLEAGGNDYVTKPFGKKELVARIEAQLRMKRFADLRARSSKAQGGASFALQGPLGSGTGAVGGSSDNAAVPAPAPEMPAGATSALPTVPAPSHTVNSALSNGASATHASRRAPSVTRPSSGGWACWGWAARGGSRGAVWCSTRGEECRCARHAAGGCCLRASARFLVPDTSVVLQEPPLEVQMPCYALLLFVRFVAKQCGRKTHATPQGTSLTWRGDWRAQGSPWVDFGNPILFHNFAAFFFVFPLFFFCALVVHALGPALYSSSAPSVLLLILHRHTVGQLTCTRFAPRGNHAAETSVLAFTSSCTCLRGLVCPSPREGVCMRFKTS